MTNKAQRPTQYHLVFCHLISLILGPGLGFANILSREAVGMCFTSNYATASAISQTGLSVSILVCAPLAQLFLDTYGWRGTLLLLGGLSMHLVSCGQLLHHILPGRQGGDYHLLAANEESSDQGKAAQQPGKLTKLCAGCSQWGLSAVQNLDLKLFCDAKFLLILTMAQCTLVPFDLWYIYFISHAQSKGFSPTDAAMFVTYAGVGSIVFKIGHAPIVDRGIVGLRSMLAVNIALCFAVLIWTPWAVAYWSTAASACVYVASVGVIANLFDVIVRDILGEDRMACALGWCSLIGGVLKFTIGFFPGRYALWCPKDDT